jgi:hypothetical protein
MRRQPIAAPWLRVGQFSRATHPELFRPHPRSSGVPKGQSMSRLIAGFALAASLFVGSASEAQVSDADIAAELMGAPVFAADGFEIGSVSKVETEADGDIGAILMVTARPLGFGEREVKLPTGSFTTLRGAVVLHLPAEAVEGLLPESTAQP